MTIPRPPYHCIQARAKKNVGDMSSTLFIVVRPVVVMPEIASNRASEKASPDPMIGNDTTSGVKRNINATRTMASLTCTSWGACILPKSPATAVRAKTTNTYLSVMCVSLLTSETTKGRTVRRATTKQSCPKYFARTEKRTA